MATIVLAHGAGSSAWVWKKMRPLMAAAGHEFFAPSYTGLGERAHLAGPANDLETHIQDVLGVIKYEDLRRRRADRAQLWRHGGDGCRRSGARRVAGLIYLDAFVPANGKALIDFLGAEERQRLLGSVKAGDGWRVTPNPIPPDTAAEDVAWVSQFRMPQSVRCFEQPIRLQAEPAVPRSYIHCTRYADKAPVSGNLPIMPDAWPAGDFTSWTRATVRMLPRRAR